jgi:hypothetical protein
LDLLKKVFTYGTKQVRKEALWLISNITANSEEDSIKVLDSNLVINIIYSCKDSTHEMRKEALWALSNICYSIQDKAKINELIGYEIITLLIEII